MTGYTALTYALVEPGRGPLLTHVDHLNGEKDGNDTVVNYSVMLKNGWFFSLIGYILESVENG